MVWNGANDPQEHPDRDANELTLADRLAPYVHLVVQTRVKADGRPRLYVGRGRGKRSRFGNPFAMTDDSDAERWRVIAACDQYIAEMDPASRELLLAEIRVHLATGGVLACFCAPKPCHGQVWCWWALDRARLEHPGD